MSRLTETAGAAALQDDREVVLRPITPNRQAKVIPLANPNGAYRLSAEALKLIDQSEARTARVFSAASTFAFR